MLCLTVIATEAGGAQRGVRMVVRDQPRGCSIELTCLHGPNVVRCEAITDRKWTPIIGAYLPLSTLDNLLDLEEDIII